MEDKQLLEYTKILQDLHSIITPTPAQIEVLEPIINGSCKTLFLQAGRKFGKTEVSLYALVRNALLNPNTCNFYIAPELSHGRKLVWTNPRLLRMIPKQYVHKVNDAQTLIRLKNGSFIQIVGSENYGVANGLTPDLVVYDETKLFHPRWHIDFNPNRIVRNAPLIIIGTPPTPGDRNTEQYKELAEFCKKDPTARWYRRTGYDNPYIDKKLLDEEKSRLFARGEQEIWYREYEARYVTGGGSAVFPMFSREKHVIPHDTLYRNHIARDIKKLEWFVSVDPGTTTCFAALIGAVNPYSRELFILGELYAKDRMQTSVRTIYPQIENLCKQFNPYGTMEDDWLKTADCAAAWFIQEVLDQFQIYFSPCDKHANKKETGLSLIKDLMLHNLLKISSNCENLVHELTNYATDDKGQIPKKDDHLIDALRYLLAAANYNMQELIEIIKKKNEITDRRGYALGKDDTLFNDTDPFTNAFNKQFLGF